MGALRLLADSYSPEELNKKGFGLYAEFRPEVGGWGGRGEIKCEKILSLRKTRIASVKGEKESETSTAEVVQDPQSKEQAEESGSSLAKVQTEGLTWEEYAATLDDTSFPLEDFEDDPAAQNENENEG